MTETKALATITINDVITFMGYRTLFSTYLTNRQTVRKEFAIADGMPQYRVRELHYGKEEGEYIYKLIYSGPNIHEAIKAYNNLT